jgi:hypothetical protein
MVGLNRSEPNHLEAYLNVIQYSIAPNSATQCHKPATAQHGIAVDRFAREIAAF